MQLKHRNLGELERKILCWWRTERDLKNQLLLRNKRYCKNISQLKGQQKNIFIRIIPCYLINFRRYSLLFLLLALDHTPRLCQRSVEQKSPLLLMHQGSR